MALRHVVCSEDRQRLCAFSRGKLALALATSSPQHAAANGSEIFDGDAEKGIRQTARADLLRDEPKRFRDPLQVMRFVLKLHREMPIVTKAVCGVTDGCSRMLWRRSRD